jgi:hypothetical protein
MLWLGLLAVLAFVVLSLLAVFVGLIVMSRPVYRAIDELDR